MGFARCISTGWLKGSPAFSSISVLSLDCSLGLSGVFCDTISMSRSLAAMAFPSAMLPIT